MSLRATFESAYASVADSVRAVCSPPREQKVFAASVRREFTKYGVGALYHVTDDANLASILEHGGLYSWAGCERKGITITRPGGDTQSRDSDRRKQLENFVRLSFNSNQPQVYVWRITGRMPRPRILKIAPSVATWQDTQYSDQNAVTTGAVVGGTIKEFRAIRLDIATATRWRGDEEKRWYQAEVMVHDHIPLSMILNKDELF